MRLEGAHLLAPPTDREKNKNYIRMEEILDFGAMEIHCNRDNYFDCKKVGIDTVLNSPVVVLGCQQAKVGDADKPEGLRKPLVLHLRKESGDEVKVFTNSKLIKEQMKAVADKYGADFPPFRAKIVKQKAKFYRLVSSTWDGDE